MTVDNCQNYGSIYSGSYQGGIVGVIDNSLVMIVYSNNYGSLFYPVVNFGAAIADCGQAGIACFTTGQLIVENCNFAGDLMTMSNIEAAAKGYYYKYNGDSAYHSSPIAVMSGVVAIVEPSNISNMEATAGSVTISKCDVSTTITNGSTYYNSAVAAVGLNVLKSILIKDCRIFIKATGALSKSDGGEASFASALLAAETKIENVQILNCYFECSTYSVWEGDRKGYCIALPILLNNDCSSLTISGIAGKIFEDATDFSLEQLNHTDDFSIACVFASGVNSITNKTVNNIMYSVDIKYPNGYDLQTFQTNINESVNNHLTAFAPNNFVFDYHFSTTDAQASAKGAIHSDESLTKFDPSIWFYADELNDGIPMLRALSWQEKNYPSQDIVSQLEKLGFIAQAAA